MSKKTSFLRKLFNRADRDGLRRRKSHRPETQVEQLEKRIALAVDVVTGAEGGAGEQWLAVLANDGSDVYLKMDATPTNDLLIADNSSFLDSASSIVTVVEGADSSFDSIYVYNGSLVNQQVQFPTDPGYSQNFGLLSTSYPSANTQELTFILSSADVDQNELITGSITLGDEDETVINFQKTPGTDGEIIGSGTPITISFGSSGGLPTITLNSPAFAGAGTHAMPMADINHDTVLSSESPAVRRTSSSGAAPPSTFQEFKLYDESTHQFVPGTLTGELAVYFGDFSGVSTPRPISFQVETTGTGVVPVSFGSASNTQWTAGNARASAATLNSGVTNTQGQTGEVTVSISGEFHTETGQLFLEAVADGGNDLRSSGSVRMPIHLDNVQLGLRDLTNTDDATDLLGTKFDNFPNDLTLFPGRTFTRSVIAELPNTASEISIENPLVVAAGTNGGQVSLSAGKVSVNSGVRAAGRFVIPGSRTTVFGTTSEIVNINAPVGSPSFDIRLDDNESTGNFVRSQFKMSRQGSLSNLTNVLAQPPATLPRANQIYLEVEDGDAFITGTIAAVEHSYVMRSEGPDPNSEENAPGSEIEGPYAFTTTSEITNVSAGEIIGDTVSMLLANDTFGLGFGTYQTMVNAIDLQTSVDRIRMQAATRQGHSADFPFPYDITIRESDNLIVDAVSASSGKIDIEAEGSLTFLASVNSMGDIKLQSGDEFVVTAPVSTSFGSIDIRGPQVTVANSVRINGRVSDPSQNDISIEATNGQLILADAVTAINGVKLAAMGESGSITGQGRVISDTIGAESTGDIVLRTDANGISARTPGVVILDDQTAAAFEIFDSPDVSLTANGLDDVVTTSPPGNSKTQGVSPALYADVTGALRLAVSAPHGSIDVLHSGTKTLEIGNGEAIASGVDVGVMTAGGSVAIRSNTAQDLIVSDAPSATSGATTVRFMTSQPLPNYYLENGIRKSATSFRPSLYPGVYPTILEITLPMDADKSVDALGGIVATDIQQIDRLLVKDGQAEHEISGIQQLTSDSEIKMPESFKLADNESIVGLVIQGAAFEEGTTISSYNDTTRIIQLSDPVITDVAPSDVVHILGSNANVVNGIYGVIGVRYEEENFVTLDLRRSSSFDTTTEISGRRYVRVTDGAMNGNHSSAGKVFASQGFQSQRSDQISYTTPLTVTPVLSSPGFITANAISTKALPAKITNNDGAKLEITAIDDGAIGFDADFFDGVVLGDDRIVLIQSPLTTEASTYTGHYGLYTVTSKGDSGAKWVLQRYRGVDDDGDGAPSSFLTGKVAITQGSLRTAVTGMMYEIGYDSLNNENLEFQEITDFRHVETETGGTYLTEDHDALNQYRTDIGTRNIVGKVTYHVASEAGNNDAPSSLGRMLQLLQGNTASIDRLDKAQLTETTFHDSVQNIQLEQELPGITSPIVLNPSREIIIDGSRIVRTRDGALVRSGALRARLGPVSPYDSPSARRLVRNAGQEIGFEHVNGLEIAPSGKGSIFGNISIGGFSNGAGISIVGADNVLLNNIRIGIDEAGNQMPNAVGIKIDQSMGGENARFTTVRNSIIASNTGAGISLGTNVDGVRVVGSEIGQSGVGNEAGVIIDTGENGISRLGVRQISPNGVVSGLQVTPLESYPSDISGAVPAGLGDPGPISRVSVAKSLATDFFEPGLQLFDRTTDQMWTVRKIELATDGLNYVMTIAGPLFGETSFGIPLALEAGYFVDAPQRAETLRLPSGVDPARLYLGQRLASSVPGAIETETYITSITILPSPETDLPQDAEQFGHYGGVVEIGLSSPVALSAQTGLFFEGPGRNVVGFNNDGIILKSGSSSIISTDVSFSNFDGIRLEGVASDGKHIIGGARGIELSSENVTISANLLTGLNFTESFFANLADGETPQTRFDQVSIKGNVFGTDLFSTPNLSNGRDGRSNIVIADPSLEQEHQTREDRDSATGRYLATYRPEDNPDQRLELEELEGLDSEGNAHFTGDPITVTGPSGSFGGGSYGGDGPELPTPPTMR